jgi:acylaminoacyl-peptidase
MKTPWRVAVVSAVAWMLGSGGPDSRGAGVPEKRLQLLDLFELEWASDPQISPDGQQVVYVRNFHDIMKDHRRSHLWVVRADGTEARPLTTGNVNDTAPRWSPDGRRLLYASGQEGSVQLYVRWMDSGQVAQLTRVSRTPSGMAWSPDGRWVAFSMPVAETPKPFVELPPKPEGAEWGKPATVIQRLLYRLDGAGYLPEAYAQLFVVPAEGGTPRQLTQGAFHHRGPIVWTPDNQALIFSANRHEDADFDPLNSEIYEVTVADGRLRALTDRRGPDRSPALSPDGRQIAYVGFDDQTQGYQVTRLYVMDRQGNGARLLSRTLDRDVEDPVWSRDGRGLYFQFDDRGNTKIAYLTLDGSWQNLAADVGGVEVGRPYASGSFSVSDNDRLAYTHTRPDHPADLALITRGAGQVQRLTRLNEDLFAGKELGTCEEFSCESRFDQRKVQGWILKPPGFVSSRKYPLILEIHGGPFANYGDRFAWELQLYAAAGYVVLYMNPRGSTSYGEEFGNLIHHNYPGQDYDDLMSGVDAILGRGYVDPDNLFVTGGSGGGVLTAWIVGQTNRFRAAVAAKPVINWYSFVLTADVYPFFHRYWFPGFPWDQPDHYLKRSPLSRVGRVQTPTMLLTGETDYRTPISESEQYYQALKLRHVDTALVRLPEASHGMDARPTQLIAKVAHILQWFERYRTDRKTE